MLLKPLWKQHSKIPLLIKPSSVRTFIDKPKYVQADKDIKTVTLIPGDGLGPETTSLTTICC